MINGGWTFLDRLRIGGEYFEASGDGNRSDASAETFRPLFASTNRILGWADLIGPANVIARSVHASWDFGRWGRLELQLWRFVKAERADAYYDRQGEARSGLSTEALVNAPYGPWQLNGQSVRPVWQLGQNLFREYDIRYIWQSGAFSVGLGYSAIYAEDSIAAELDQIYAPIDQRRYRFDRRADFAYLQIQASF